MKKIIEGIYSNGTIKLKENYSFPENIKLKIIVLEESDKKKFDNLNKDFSSYKIGEKLDDMNIREFAYED